MSDYLFRKVNIATRATENIEKYRTNRSEVIKAHIQAIKEDIESQVLNVSRTTGGCKLEYSISKFPLPKEHAKITIRPLDNNSELDHIVKVIVEWCEKEGLKTTVPGRQYNSLYYKCNMHLSWDNPSEECDKLTCPLDKGDNGSKSGKGDKGQGLVQIR